METSSVPPPSHPPNIPLIPLPPLLTSSALTLPTAQSLLGALRTSGFFYLTDGTPPVLPTIFELSARFFAQPQDHKDRLAWTTPQANRGYVRLGREKVSHGGTREQVALDREGSGDDLKESFEIGRDNSDVPGEENRWPDENEEGGGGGGGGSLVGFKPAMMAFYDQCQTIHVAIMRGVALALGLPAGFFDEYMSDGENTMRLLHYPAVAKEVLAGGARVRAGAHTDYGSVTLLFQDARGGLQVERLADGGVGGGFVDVEPRPGTVVVNAGDLLTRWSNGLVRSTVHRVVEPPPPVLATDNHDDDDDDDDEGEVNGGGGQGYPARYSIAYFGNPNFDRWIDALPGTWEGEKGGKKFEPVKSGDYLVSRLSATY